MSATSESRVRGRPVLGGVLGLVFGLLLAFDLLQMGVFALDSVLVIVLPVIMLVVGVALGVVAPFRMFKR